MRVRSSGRRCGGSGSGLLLVMFAVGTGYFNKGVKRGIS